MTETQNPPSPGPSAAVAKGIALGMGVLLIAGTLLLITMLVTRAPQPSAAALSAIELQASEKVTDVSLLDNRAILLVQSSNGSQRLVMIDLATGAREDVPIVSE